MFLRNTHLVFKFRTLLLLEETISSVLWPQQMNILLPCFCHGIRQFSCEKPEHDTLQGGGDVDSDIGAPARKSPPPPETKPQEGSQMLPASVIRN